MVDRQLNLMRTTVTPYSQSGASQGRCSRFAMVALACILLLPAGCDSGDPPMFHRPRLQGKSYVSARVDPSDSSLAQIEFTNIGVKPLKEMDFLILADGLPPVKNATVNPSETKVLGKVRPGEASHPTEIMILSDEYFPQFFFVGRQSDGVMAVTEDGYGGHQGYAEYFVRTQMEEVTSAKRWQLFYKILKVSGVVIGVLALAVVSFFVGRRRSAPTEVK